MHIIDLAMAAHKDVTDAYNANPNPETALALCSRRMEVVYQLEVTPAAGTIEVLALANMTYEIARKHRLPFQHKINEQIIRLQDKKRGIVYD